MKHNFFRKTALAAFIIILSASFIFPNIFTRQAGAWIMIYSYIHNFTISPTDISYEQERDGYVCIKAYPYYPEYIDPEYPEDEPYSFIDFDHPINIHSGQFELAGQKNVSWQGRDQSGDILAPGLYKFGAMIYSGPNCGGWTISQCEAYREFEVTAPPPPQSWSFAIISDLHVGQEDFDFDYGGSTWNDGVSGEDDISSVGNLKNTIDIINSNIQKYNLQFAVVTGDFSDSAELSELNKAKEILDTLNIPWVPIIGNHDIWPYYGKKWELIGRENQMAPEITDGNGTDKYFYDLFAEQYQELANTFSDFQKQSAPSWNPFVDPERNSYLENFFFDFNGYHFIGLDFNSRGIEQWPAKGAAARGDLNSFENGTWFWLLNHLEQYISENPDGYEKIILLAHHPFRKDYWQELYDLKMYNIGFSDKELTAMHESLVPYWDQIYALFAGHTHENKEYSFTGDLLKIVETDANVDGPLARLVQFYPDGRIDYSKMLGNAMQITAHSPIDLEIIDPDGLIINKLMNEISGASYFEEDIDGDGDSEDLIEIAERKEGDYQIRAIPEPDALPDETYSLDVSLLEDNFGYTPIVLAQDVPVSQIPSEPYNFEAQQRVVASLVYNGDLFSQYSDSVNLSAVLNDANNNPLAGKSIVFKIGEQTVSALTDSDGIANASLVLNQIPGQYYLVETGFSGDENYLPAADIKDFEILKEDTNINILGKEGFVLDDIILEAEVKDGDGQTLLQEAEVEFKIDNRGLGMARVGEAGIATSSWQADLIPEESTEIYPIQVIFAGNDYYEPAQGQASFVLKSAKWLKQDAVARLDNIDVSDKKLNSEILAAENLIQDSLADDLWLDSSHIIFFDRECLGQNESAVDLERIGVEALFETGKLANISQKCFQLKSGLKVFGNEYLAIRRLQEKNSGKQKTPEELKTIFDQVIGKLVEADKLLAKVAIYDAENAPVVDSKFQKNVEWRITESKKSLAKAEEAILRGRPDKAIIEFAHSWLYAQIALRFAD